MLKQVQLCTLLRECARVSLNANEGVKNTEEHRNWTLTLDGFF